MQDIKQAFAKAIEFENKGEKIYQQTAEKTGCPLIKKTFEFLALQEAEHAKEIANYDKVIVAEAIFDITKLVDVEAVKEAEEFFGITVKEFKDSVGKATEDDIKVYETAMALEKESYNFYKEHHDKTGDVHLKQFLKFLMQQENAHYELLEKTLRFIKDPISFHAEEESWHVDGG